MESLVNSVRCDQEEGERWLVGGASNANHGTWQIPYGALLPVKIDNLLAAGHRVILDATFLRRQDRARARSIAAARGLPSIVVAVEASSDWLDARVRRDPPPSATPIARRVWKGPRCLC